MRNLKKLFNHQQIKIDLERLVEVGLLLTIVLMIILPVFKFYLIGFSKGDINELYQAVKQTLSISICVVGIVTPLSMICAFGVTYTNIKNKSLFSVLCILPFFLPPISFGFSLLLNFGKNGIVYCLFGIRIPLMGKLGIIIGHFFYAFPPAFLMFRNAMQSTNSTLYENAVLLGIPLRKYIIRILFPQIKKTIVAVIFSVMLLSMTEYTICLVVGGRVKTLALLIYRQVSGSMDFSAAAVMGFLLAIPLILLIIVNILSPNTMITITYKKLSVPIDKRRDHICCIFLFGISCIFFLSIFSFLIAGFVEGYELNVSFTLKHVIQVFRMPYAKYYINSIIIASLTSLFGSILAFFCAYYAWKGKSMLVKRLFYAISVTPQMIPGLIYGISYMLFFKGTVIYNSLTILVMVNIAHFFASPFLYSYQSFAQLGEELGEIIKLYGIPWQCAIRDIYFPCFYTTLSNMFFFFFINAMITISAVVFLYTARTMPYSVLLNNFEGSLEYLNKASAVSFIILSTNILVSMGGLVIKKVGTKQ